MNVKSFKNILMAMCGGINKRTKKIQTSWMKDRPWLFHDEETDR
jgi:hypothetical protein